VAGFTTHEEREKHRKSHQRLFKCTHETCDYFVIGLPSEAALKMHLSLCHEIPSEQPVFASIKTQSLEKGLKDAIEANDLMAVTALATELASFPERSKGYVLQAITLKHREVVFVLLDLLGTPSEINHIHKKRTAILTACEIGDEVLLNKLLEKGGDINIHSRLQSVSYQNDFHPLSLAAQNGHITVVRILLNHKDLDLDGSYGAYKRKGALTLASMGGFLEIVALLLESDLKSFLADPLQINRSLKAALRSGQVSTARLILKWAFENGMKSKLKLPSSIHKIPEDDMDKIIHALSEANREIDEKGGTRENSLQANAHKGDLAAVSRLLDLGADIENNSGEWGTPLMAAASAGKLEVMQLLIDRGANIMTIDVGKDRSGGSAIDYAAARGQEKMIKALIDKGARFNLQSLHWTSSYHHQPRFNVLQMASRHKNSAPVLRLLFEYGAKVNEVERNESQSQMSPLQVAAQYGDRDSLQVLLDYGADVNFTNPDGNTPVHSAVEGGQSENLKLLIKQGANINATNKTKKSALMLTMDYSWRDQSSSLIQILVDNGADIDITDCDGNTALMLAASKGYSLTTLDGFKILVQHGANIRTRNSKRLTVLMIAASQYNHGFFEYLLQNKSDLYTNEVEEIGDALNLAASNGRLKIVKLLLEFFGKMDLRDGRFNAALSVALSSATSKGHLDIIPLLLEYGAEETEPAA
jgi:ankyrin repeat protein